mgnify:CR=1 FL=1
MKNSIIFLLLIVFFNTSCQKGEGHKEMIIGTWKLVENNIESGEIPYFKKLCFTESNPWCNDKIYFSEEKIEFPLGWINEKSYPGMNFINYELEGNQIRVFGEESFKMDISVSKSELILGDTQLRFERAIDEPSELDSIFFSFEVQYDGELSLDFQIDENGYLEFFHSANPDMKKVKIPDSDLSYFYELLGRIKKSDLNRIYNTNLSDCREYEFRFTHQNEGLYEVKTCSFRYDQPFEIKAVILNIHRLIEKLD